jgi:hypothetical protein
VLGVGRAEPRGTVVDNAYSRRVRYIVLRSAADAADTWVDERRDVAADFPAGLWRRSATVPPLTGVIVAGDADNTGGRSVAFRGRPAAGALNDDDVPMSKRLVLLGGGHAHVQVLHALATRADGRVPMCC